jgi:gliding motility-associated-like protein
VTGQLTRKAYRKLSFEFSEYMKKLISLLMIFCACFDAKADHITGGEMSYVYLGDNRYRITIKQFMRCNSGRSFNNPAVISIYEKGTHTFMGNLNVPFDHSETISISDQISCVINPPEVCYEVGYYYYNALIPPSAKGYILASQVNFRVSGINNLEWGYSQIGATYTCEIPGSNPVSTGPQNNSAKFVGSDLVMVCANNFFSYSFAAQDDDGDELIYSFCDAYRSTNIGSGGASALPPGSPPYHPVPYGNGFTGTSPLGANVQINPTTGLITGTAPQAGIYVVTVCVQEKRNGVVIATQRKDLQLNIASCTIVGAELEPEYMLCRNSYSITLSNLSDNTTITNYNWVISTAAGAVIHTSTAPVVNYTFADTGSYRVKLKISSSLGCIDSTTSIVRVYPGFIPSFTVNGTCFTKPTRFNDVTSTSYGVVNFWQWDFGEVNSTNDNSTMKSPVYTYPTEGQKLVVLKVGNSVGCRDTISHIVQVSQTPPIPLAFKDTLICIPDSVQLHATGVGNFSWTPTTNMSNATSASPTVAPRVTTRYYVQLENDGCLSTDSVLIRVTDHVSLQVMSDTTICSTDTIQLKVISDGLRYNWTPATQLIDASAKQPFAVTRDTTTYVVTARIGSCSTTEDVRVNTVPYPIANAGADTTICFATTAKLNGTINGNRFEWQPTLHLDNPSALSTTSRPVGTIKYTLLSFDTKGCPKPGTDEVFINVKTPIRAFAGRDTAVVVNQPLQLNATGNDVVTFHWSPPFSLSNPAIANPIAVFDAPADNNRLKVVISSAEGCSDSAFLNVRVYKSAPVIFVPTAFTPNNDGKNDVFRPILAGMKKMDFFRIYNRNGNLVFSSNEPGKGWDGKLGGKPQDTGVYVWMFKGVDYTGKNYQDKGSFVLIR